MDYDELHEETLSDLRNWAYTAWEEVIEPSMTRGNPVTYHKCCNAFTTRTMTDKSEHPDKQTMKEFRKANKVKDNASFYAWVVNHVHERVRLGMSAYEPTLNTKHHLPGTPKPPIKTNDIESEFLKKRLELVEDELSNTRLRADRLQETIEKLQDTIEKLKKPTTRPKPREKMSASKASLSKTMSSEKTLNIVGSERYLTPRKQLKHS